MVATTHMYNPQQSDKICFLWFHIGWIIYSLFIRCFDFACQHILWHFYATDIQPIGCFQILPNDASEHGISIINAPWEVEQIQESTLHYCIDAASKKFQTIPTKNLD